MFLTIKNSVLLPVLYVFVGVLFLVPYTHIHADFSPFPQADQGQLYKMASVSNTTSRLTFHDVHLSDLNPDITGELGDVVVSVPSSVVANDLGVASLSEIDGYFEIAVFSKDDVWLDKKNNFVVNDPYTNKPVLLESLNKAYGISNSKKGVFQGLRANPTLIRTGILKGVTTSGVKSSGSGVEGSSIFIYDSSVQHTIGITFVAAIESSKTNQKIWQTLLKSLDGTKKKKTEVTKKNQTSAALESTVTKRTNFSLKLPKGWSIENNEANNITLLAPNLGASIGVGAVDLESPLDYDPQLLAFWVNTFKNQYKDRLDGFVFKSSKNVTIDGIPGFRMDYKAVFEGVPMEGYQLITILDGMEYVLTATVTDKNQWKQYDDVITKSFATFRRAK